MRVKGTIMNFFRFLETDPRVPVKSTKILVHQLGIAKFVYVERRKN